MDHKHKNALAVAIAAGVAGMTVTDDAAATTYGATLTQIQTYSNSGSTTLNFSSSTGDANASLRFAQHNVEAPDWFTGATASELAVLRRCVRRPKAVV